MIRASADFSRGARFGQLTILRRSPAPKSVGARLGRKYWLCACDCGRSTIVRTDQLTSGKKQSCGCTKS